MARWSQGKEPVEFRGKTSTESFSSDGATPQGQKVSLDFWVADNRKINQAGRGLRRAGSYQEGFERKAPPAAPKATPRVASHNELRDITISSELSQVRGAAIVIENPGDMA